MANNHLPFEEWLFSGSELTVDETAQLRQHLATCERCRDLAATWQAVEAELRAAPILGPAPGFTARWQARMAAEKTRRHRRQTFWMLLLTVSGAVMFLLLLGLVMLSLVRSPTSLVYVWLSQLAATLAYLSVVGGAGATIVKTIASLVPPTTWIALSVAVASLAALWIAAIRHFTFSRREKIL